MVAQQTPNKKEKETSTESKDNKGSKQKKNIVSAISPLFRLVPRRSATAEGGRYGLGSMAGWDRHTSTSGRPSGWGRPASGMTVVVGMLACGRARSFLEPIPIAGGYGSRRRSVTPPRIEGLHTACRQHRRAIVRLRLLTGPRYKTTSVRCRHQLVLWTENGGEEKRTRNVVTLTFISFSTLP